MINTIQQRNERHKMAIHGTKSLTIIVGMLMLALSSHLAYAFEGAEVGGGGNLRYVELRTDIELIHHVMSEPELFKESLFTGFSDDSLAETKQKMQLAEITILETCVEFKETMEFACLPEAKQDGIAALTEQGNVKIGIILSKLALQGDQTKTAALFYLENLSEFLELDEEIVSRVADVILKAKD